MNLCAKKSLLNGFFRGDEGGIKWMHYGENFKKILRSTINVYTH